MKSRRSFGGRAALRAVLVFVLAAPAWVATAADSSAAETYPVTSSGGFLLEGRGWGHGRGLSQWGAQGAALAGLSAAPILQFYYPGSGIQSGLAPAERRVRLTAEDSDLQIEPSTGLVATDLASGARLDLSTAGSRVRAVAIGDGTLRVQKLGVGGWADLTHASWPGNVVRGPVEFQATNPLWTFPPGGERQYRGVLVAQAAGAGMTVINRVGMEDYLLSVVPSEMPASWGTEALKAQAVAARSYASFPCRANTGYDVLDTTSCQVYGGMATRSGGIVTPIEHPRSTAAVQATAGQVVSYQGAAYQTEFSSSNGGWTVAAGPWPARPDAYDGVSGNSGYRWTTTVPASRLEAAYPSIGRLGQLVVLKRDGNGEWGGRVLAAQLVGTLGTKDLTGDQLRSAGGLMSTWIHPTGYGPVTLAAISTGVQTDVRSFGATPLGVREGVSVTSAFGPTSSDWQFFLTREADLVGVQLRGGASGRVEVHTLTAASGYTMFSVHAATPLGALPAGSDAQFAIASRAGDHRANLWFIPSTGTGSGRIEVHALSAASGYQQWVVHSATPLAPAAPGQFTLLVGDELGSGDLVGVLHGPNTGSGRSEAHVLSAASGWSVFTLHVALPLGPTDDASYTWGLGEVDTDGRPDLVLVARGTTGSGKVEVHALAGSSGFTGWILHAATTLSAPNQRSFPIRPQT